MPVEDAGVRDSGGGDGQKIIVMRQNDSLLAPGKFQMLFVGRSNQANINQHCHIVASATKAIGNGGINVLVEMKLEGHVLGGTRELGSQLGRILFPKRLREILSLLHLLVDLLTVGVIIAERAVNSGK